MDEIVSRPTFKAMQDSKLALTDLENMSNREEAFASNLAESSPACVRRAAPMSRS
jgi:hypothetical protein